MSGALFSACNLLRVPPVDAFSITGLDLDFLSNDHWPPHFHVTRRGKWEIRVYILTTTKDKLDFDIKWPKNAGAGPRGRLQRTLRRHVVLHRAALLEEYRAKVNFDPPSQP